MTDTLQILYHAREKVVQLVLKDPVYLPIFERLEKEIEIEEARGDALARVRAISRRQKAIA